LRRKQGCNEIGKCCPFLGEKCQLTSLSTQFQFISPWNVGVLGACTTAAAWPLFKFADPQATCQARNSCSFGVFQWTFEGTSCAGGYRWNQVGPWWGCYRCNKLGAESERIYGA
jgi:hypothetical protein